MEMAQFTEVSIGCKCIFLSNRFLFILSITFHLNIFCINMLISTEYICQK